MERGFKATAKTDGNLRNIRSHSPTTTETKISVQEEEELKKKSQNEEEASKNKSQKDNINVLGLASSSNKENVNKCLQRPINSSSPISDSKTQKKIPETQSKSCALQLINKETSRELPPVLCNHYQALLSLNDDDKIDKCQIMVA
ncbi:unnamed protein product [Arabidopsis lyrata]|uniref:Predicted protein n=1 Tax=Arabidopsis lyrata subsp. lyrata TaxID=81972 RepID=D7M7K2_ARALL|nr:predicted protein [Arabidopsis lyrata subsp. lyrata]CAH8272555.1 unnamed protein product [Arabidopsis lyrata]